MQADSISSSAPDQTSSSGSRRGWLAIVSADHAARGRDDGFIQVCHGRAAPLRRIRSGDAIAVYVPTSSFRGRDKCQSFVSFGIARDDAVFAVDMGGGFVPYRRAVYYFTNARPAPIQPLLRSLVLTRGKTNWGYPFRFGLLPLSAEDVGTIASAMAVDLAL